MTCPVCEAKLSFPEVVLAETRTGTQCPRCWTRLRFLKQPAPLAFPRRRKQAQTPPTAYRRAA